MSPKPVEEILSPRTKKEKEELKKKEKEEKERLKKEEKEREKKQKEERVSSSLFRFCRRLRLLFVCRRRDGSL